MVTAKGSRRKLSAALARNAEAAAPGKLARIVAEARVGVESGVSGIATLAALLGTWGGAVVHPRG